MPQVPGSVKNLKNEKMKNCKTGAAFITCPGLSIKWTGQRLVTDCGTKCAWVIHESKAVQYMYITIAAASVPRVPSIVKNPHNNNFKSGGGGGGGGWVA